jgi:anthranilate synthase component 1
MSVAEIDRTKQTSRLQPSLDELAARVSQLPPGVRTWPVYRELVADLETPVSAYLKVSHGATRPGFLLESVEGGRRIGRYSFLGADPMTTIRMRDKSITAPGLDGIPATYDDPLAALAEILDGFRTAPVPGLPRFSGGAVGYLAYDAIASFEPRVGLAKGNGLDLPEACYHLANSLIVFDHLERSMKAVFHVRIGHGVDLEAEYRRAEAEIDRLAGLLAQPVPAPQPTRVAPEVSVADRLRPNTSPERYRQIVERVKEYIYAGDIFQCVPSQRVDVETPAQPFMLYRALRMINPSPYMYFLDFGDHQVVGASPELLVRLENGVITNHPIAGTRPRGETPEQDTQLAEELIADEKERAEHIMLVDLGRNDVGRVAKAGTVHVPQFMEIERFSHVMHLVSHVEGELRDDLTGLDALRACFPAGTVSGAPKIRAMEIIAELETDRRGVYSGAVGYIDFSGGIDTCITLRTMVVKDGIASLQAGGGVVADSTPDNEYAESFHKMRALIRAIEKAEAIEASLASPAAG